MTYGGDANAERQPLAMLDVNRILFSNVISLNQIATVTTSYVSHQRG